MSVHEVFLSYASRDGEWTAVLERNLRRCRISVFRDQARLAVGDDWMQGLQRNLEKVDKVVLVLSPGSMASGWVTREWQAWLARHGGWSQRRLFAVRLCAAPDAPFLTTTQEVDLRARDREGYFAGLRELVGALRGRAKSDAPTLPNDLEMPERWPVYLEPELRGRLVAFAAAQCPKNKDLHLLAQGLGLPKDELKRYATPELAVSAGLERITAGASPSRHGLVLLEALLEQELVEPDTDEHTALVELRADLEALSETPRAEDDLAPYLDRVIAEHGKLRIVGIGSGHGRTKEALHPPIEQIYTTLRARRGMELAADGEPHPRTAEPAHLGALLPHHQRLLIEGQPGAGKTTFLRLVCCMLARDRAGVPCPDASSWRAKYLGLADDEPARVPVFVRIAELVALIEPEPEGADSRHRLLDLVAQQCGRSRVGLNDARWESVFQRGDAWLLLDGLDEVAEPKLRARVFAIFDDACRHWPDCPVTVTSRPIATEQLRRDHDFSYAEIDSFDRGQIEAFIERWVDALFERPAEGEHTPEAADYRTALRGAILQRATILRLAQNPVMLTCLCVVHWNEGRLPEGRARVYRAVLRWLLEQRREQRTAAGFEERFALRAFAQLALAMMGRHGGKRAVFDLEDGANAIGEILARHFPDGDDADRRQRGREWLRFECLGSGIVEELPGHKVRFWHLTFQEYLAAYELVLRSDGPEAAGGWWPIVRSRLEDTQWRETIDIFPGCLFDEGGEGRVDQLLTQALALDHREDRSILTLEFGEGGDDLAVEAARAGLIGRLLQPLDVYGYKAKPAVRDAYERALAESMRMFTVEGAEQVPWQVRVAAAEALGRAGDPRLAPERWEENMLEVPGCDGLRLGRYLVTVEEFLRFLDDRGYEREPLWGEHWAHREKHDWTEPGSWAEQLAHPNRPVVEVSWYEAQAYCAWLSELKQADVRLPTSDERDRAAKHPSGEYPWGAAEPDPERANFGRNVGAPSPVGIYPRGAGNHGHEDLAGNVWEWCEDTQRVDRDEEARMHLRGGAWLDEPVSLRSGFRGRLWAWYRILSFGFRVALSPASRSAP
ncbi:MAG: SUMF1/EgtB/PvdO family nonheme iron enzyme [Planctomycetota bacterium]